MRRLSLIAVLVVMTMAGSAQADVIFENWDAGDLGDWTIPSMGVDLEVMASGGVSDTGYLHSYESATGINIVGALQRFEPYIGDFGVHYYRHAQVALQFQSGSFIEVIFRVRYLDASHNGWHATLTDDFTPGVWHVCSVEFDPTWSDVDAIAAGWVSEGSAPSFAETFANVYTIEVRASGGGDLSIGVDAFGLGEGLTPTESNSWSQVKQLY